MTRPWTEPSSPGPLANTLPTRPMDQVDRMKVLDSGLRVYEFEHQSLYKAHFRAYTLEKGMNALIPPDVETDNIIESQISECI